MTILDGIFPEGSYLLDIPEGTPVITINVPFTNWMDWIQEANVAAKNQYIKPIRYRFNLRHREDAELEINKNQKTTRLRWKTLEQFVGEPGVELIRFGETYLLGQKEHNPPFEVYKIVPFTDPFSE